MHITFVFKMTFADGYQCSVRAETVHDAIWSVEADTKTHGIITKVV